LTRQPAGRPRDKRKGRRRPAPPPAVARARAAPVGAAATKVAQPARTAGKPKAPNPMDFRYVNAELRRILVFVVGMIGLLVVLSFILR
jgi:hypothetical protein